MILNTYYYKLDTRISSQLYAYTIIIGNILITYSIQLLRLNFILLNFNCLYIFTVFNLILER